MPKMRKPATAEEVQEFFATEPLETANLMYRLIGVALKKRQPAAAQKPRKPSRPKTPTAVPGAAADPQA